MATTDKVERLLNLIAVLLDAPRPVAAAEIRRRVPGYPDSKESFQRAFERDKEDLRAMGIRLRLEPVPLTDPPTEGYRIRKDEYYLRDPGLTDDERAALQVAAATVRLDAPSGTRAIWKLGGAEQAAAPADTEAFATDLPPDPSLVALFTGVLERRVVRFRYRSVDRAVDPWRLHFQRGRWYLSGFDHVRDQERVFRLDRIEGAVEVGDEPSATTAPPPEAGGLQLEPWQLGEGDPVRAVVRVDVDHAEQALGLSGAELVARTADHVDVAFETTNRDGLRGLVLNFLDHAELLEPAELRDDLVTWLEDLVAAGAGER